MHWIILLNFNKRRIIFVIKIKYINNKINEQSIAGIYVGQIIKIPINWQADESSAHLIKKKK